MIKTPVSMPDLSGNEKKYVIEAIESTWISSSGKFVDKFERDFADMCATEYALSLCNGTVALHLALMALGVRPGDEVLVPSLTYVATANAVRYVGAEPVFIDVDPATWCIDPALLEDNITRRTKGIIAVHLYGHPADMDEINHIAAIHGLWVVEDAAEAHFAKYKGKNVGGLSEVATFSFFGNKLITSGEGGAITLNNSQIYKRAKTLRGQGMDPDRKYFFPVTGYNFRLTNIACALLCAQLERAKELFSRRLLIFKKYKEMLKAIPGINFQPVAKWADPAPWLFCITVDEAKYGMSRNQLIEELLAKGIDSRPFFIPLHTLPPFREQSLQRNETLPFTDAISKIGINLPTFSSMTDDEISLVCEVVRGGGG